LKWHPPATLDRSSIPIHLARLQGGNSFVLSNSAASRPPAIINGLLTAVLAVWGFTFIAGYRLNLPLGDEILWLPYLTGERAVTLHWLWSQHNDHRLLIPRLLYLTLWNGGAHSFKLPMYFGFTCLLLVAVALQIASARLRGRASYFDCIFPLLFLNLGHAENFLSGYNSVCNIVTVAAIVALMAIFTIFPDLRSRPACVAAICILPCLPMTTGTGALLALPLSAVFVVAGLERRRSATDRSLWIAWGFFAAAAAAVAVVALEIATRRHRAAPAEPAIPVLLNALKLLTMSFGPFLQERKGYWTGYFALLAATALTVLGFSIFAYWKRPRARLQLALLLALIPGFIAVAAAIAYSRTHFGIDAGLQTRYSLLCAPLLCCLFLAAQIACPAPFAEAVQFLLFFAVALSIGASTALGAAWREERNQYVDTVSAGVRMGWTLPDLIETSRAHNFIHPKVRRFDAFFRRLGAARLGPFEGSAPLDAARPSPSFDLAAPKLRGYVDSCEYEGIAYRVTGWAVCGNAPSASFALPLDGGGLQTAEHQQRGDVEQAVGVANAGFLIVAPPRIAGRHVAVYACCAGSTEYYRLEQAEVTCPPLPR
jgi:hypothetical protein